jgi:hypothetical protein
MGDWCGRRLSPSLVLTSLIDGSLLPVSNSLLLRVIEFIPHLLLLSLNRLEYGEPFGGVCDLAAVDRLRRHRQHRLQRREGGGAEKREITRHRAGSAERRSGAAAEDGGRRNPEVDWHASTKATPRRRVSRRQRCMTRTPTLVHIDRALTLRDSPTEAQTNDASNEAAKVAINQRPTELCISYIKPVWLSHIVRSHLLLSYVHDAVFCCLRLRRHCHCEFTVVVLSHVHIESVHTRRTWHTVSYVCGEIPVALESSRCHSGHAIDGCHDGRMSRGTHIRPACVCRRHSLGSIPSCAHVRAECRGW